LSVTSPFSASAGATLSSLWELTLSSGGELSVDREVEIDEEGLSVLFAFFGRNIVEVMSVEVCLKCE
jgi:hypothetical protein